MTTLKNYGPALLLIVAGVVMLAHLMRPIVLYYMHPHSIVHEVIG